MLERETRKRELIRKVQGLMESLEKEPELLRVKKEISRYEDEIRNSAQRSAALSVRGAFLYPFCFFLFGLISSVYGLSALTAAEMPAAAVLGTMSVLIGVIAIVRTLFVINEAAIRPETLVAFSVFFVGGSTVQKVPRSSDSTISVGVHNCGKQMAEDVEVGVLFPPEFVVSPGSDYQVTIQDSVSTYPNHTSADFNIARMHEDVYEDLTPIKVKSPTKPGKYLLRVGVWERELGETDHMLTIDVE